MKRESKGVERPERSERILAGITALAAVALVSLVPAAVQAGGGGPTGPSDAVSFEEIPGSTIKRVILTARAAERLGIETGKVDEQQIVRKQIVGGRIIAPKLIQPAPELAGGKFGGFGQIPASLKLKQAPAPAVSPALGEALVHVTLSMGEWDRLEKEAPARILALATRDQLQNNVLALPSKMPPAQDMKRSMLSLYYVLPDQDNGQTLNLNERVRVELQLSGSGEIRKVVPYSAVYYDGQGMPWVYVNPAPLTYERQPIEVERIAGDLAFLTGGPPVGTPVVTVGVALLYGAEVIFKR